MNKISAFIASGVCLLSLGACSNPGPRSVEMPSFAATSTTSIDVRGVELTDSTTVLNIHATYRPGWWIRVDSATTIKADGKDYRLIGSSENFKIGEHFTLPESGEDDFTLIFEPIPFETETIDFDENTEEAFKIWGIDVTGKKSGYAPELTKLLPGDVRDIDVSEVFSDAVLESTPTEIRFHVLGYRPEYGSDLSLNIQSFADSSTSTIKLDEKGDASLTATLYGPTKIYASIDGTVAQLMNGILVAPGVATDIYIDPAYSSDVVIAKRPGMKVNQFPRMFDNGKYAALNRVVGHTGKLIAEGKDLSWKATPDEVIANILDVHKASLDSLKTKDFSEGARAYCKTIIDGNALMSAADAVSGLCYKYYIEKGSAEGMNDSINMNYTPELYAKVLNAVDKDNARLLAYPGLGIMLRGWDADLKDGLMKDIVTYVGLYEKAKSGTLADADLTVLANASSPFFANALKARNNETKEIEARLKEKIASLPDDAPEKYFQNIIDKYKGKVVLVDLWNTWCGPCRAALKENEPLKSSTLTDPDIVWVYIADTSSDLAQYEKMIPGIKGEHYMASKEQKKAINDRFNVDGIPFYILVDREGNAVRHPDYRNHDLMVEGIKAALAK